MITPAYAPTATERVLPRLALDFTTGALDPRVTVARALNTATRVNSSGYIENVSADLPRFDYDPVTLAPRGLLVEEQRTNLLVRSEEFDNAAWVKSAATVTANAAVSPDGTADAEKLVEDTANSAHSVAQFAGTIGAVETFSVFAKQGERQWIVLQMGGSYAYFNLATGLIGTTSGAAATISNFGNGWYRCAITATRAANTLSTIYPATANGTVSYTGDGTSGVFIWGAQLEAGAFPTSYIPTTTTSLTRNADVVSMTGTNFSSWWNASQGTFVVQADTVLASGNRILEASAGSTSRVVDLYATTSGGVLVQMYNGTSAFNTVGFLTLGQQFKIAAAYKSGDYGVVTNGSTVVTKTDALLNTANALQIGRFSGGSNYLNGHIAKINYYPQRVLNAETQTFSK